MAEITDFMTIEEGAHSHDLVRIVRTVRGEVRFRSPVPLETIRGAVTAEFRLCAGESAAFVLEEAKPGVPSPSAREDYAHRALRKTLSYWRRWMGRSTYRGRWREMVNRSALALKLLTSAPDGSIVAAPTFGLPEEIGGVRNWDYRYAWIRDASFTVYALIRLGYTEEAAAFMRWIEARCRELREDGSLQVMYGINGRHDLPETVLSHFEGYRKSAPVRIGNAASTQLQLDIYGELMDSVYLYNKYGEPISYDLWTDLVRLIEWVCGNWTRKDEGTFTMCSFWYVECLSRAGDLEKARFYFEKMLGYANHLGLYSEELGPRGEHLGNYPQAFTHLGLISAAYNLDRNLSGG